MINLKLKLGEDYHNVEILEEYLFNAYLANYPELIKKLIHTIVFKYKISKTYFHVVNAFVELSDNIRISYPGLIVRVDVNRYAVLYLQDKQVDEKHMVDLIKEYIYDKGEHIPDEICVDKFEIDKASFLEAAKNI